MKNREEIVLPELKSKKKVVTLDVDAFLENQESVIFDIRSPAEYELGHIARAISFPLFSNEERAEVGTIYKKIGKDKAVERGLEIVGPKLAQFVKSAKSFGCNKDFYLYCWRGGMRSGSMSWLLSTAGLSVTLLKGGYKAYRQSFNDVIAQNWKFITLLGSTGTGKTELLERLKEKGEQILDLEALANHRGSAFGSFGLGKQPSTEEFINRIHTELRKLDPSKHVWVEGESIMIGSCFIPNELYDKLLLSKYYHVEMPMLDRIERLFVDYGGFEAELIESAFAKITKRMGGNNVKDALDAYHSGDIRATIKFALDYYDKGYAMASDKRKGECIGVLNIENNDLYSAAQRLIDSVEIEN